MLLCYLNLQCRNKVGTTGCKCRKGLSGTGGVRVDKEEMEIDEGGGCSLEAGGDEDKGRWVFVMIGKQGAHIG